MFGRKIWETTSSPGTGTITLLGANPGYLRCRDMKPGATSFRACWQIDNETDTEVFIGTLTLGTPDTLTRDTVLMSTNGGAKINAVGTFSVFSPIDIIQALPRVNQQAGAYSVVAEDYNSVIEYTGTGDVTFTVPDVATLVPGFFFTLKHAGTAGSVTLDPSGSQLYEGQGTVVLRPGMSIQPVSTATGWRERGNIGYLPALVNWTGKTIQAATLLNALLNGTVYGSAIGIGPEQLVVNRNLGPLAYAGTIDAGDLRGTANRIMVTDGSGIGTEGTVAGGLALSAGVLTGTVLRGHIDGLTLSNNVSDANNDIDIAAGQAADDGAAAYLSLGATLTKRLDAAWAVGSGNGGIDTGSKANSTWYHLWLIQRPDTGVVDALFSTSATAPTMPANYTRKRRIGAVLTDGSGNIRAFTQIGDSFHLNTALGTTASFGTTATDITLAGVPTGVSVIALLDLALQSDVSAYSVRVYSKVQADTAPSGTAVPGMTLYKPASANAAAYKEIWTDTSGRIRAVASATITNLICSVNGWRDPRGRNL
ncbi:MAG: hypothetical protein KBC46_03515 [Ferrovibrio sp.]|nr:hypothetical protein [Ferrovibrio sp.]